MVIVIALPSSMVSAEHVVAAVAHALRECPLEGLVGLYATHGARAEPAGCPPDGRAPPGRTGRRPDRRAAGGSEQPASERTSRCLAGGASRHLHSELPDFLQVAGDELPLRVTLGVHRR